MAQKLFLLPGDGIGTEIMKEVEKVIAWLNSQGETDFTFDTGLVGGSAYDAHGEAISSVLADGLRTGDIAQDNRKTVGTEEMGAAILKKLAA